MSVIHALHHQNDKLLGYLNNTGNKLFWGDKHIESLDGEHHFEFKMPSNIEEAEYFDELSRILVPLEDGGFEEFIVYRTEVDMRNVKQVYAVAAYTDMNKDHLMHIGTYTGTLREIVAQALPSTEWVVNAVESNAIRTIHLANKEGVYKFLKRVASAFDREMRFRIETTGSRISVRYVDFVQKVGFDTKKEIEYGKDLLDIKKSVFNDRIVTALEGRGPDRDDGTWLTSYIFDEDAFQRWNRRGKHRVEEYVPESDRQEMTQDELDQYTRTELNKRIASIVEYEITAAAVEKLFPHEKVRIGDRVRVKNPEFSPPLYADARAIRVERSIVDPSKKTYVIGEVKTYSEEEIMTSFRALQRIYGVKLIKSETTPNGQPKTIWIKEDKLEPLKPSVPHTFNTETQMWEKFSPTSAAEIGGVVVGQQYNGVSITPEDGLGVTRTDGLVRTFVNATEGIYIETISDETGIYKKVFYADEFGNLTFGGIIRGSEIILGGEDNKDGTLRVLNAGGELSSELRAGYFGTEEARVGYLDAPNKLEYADLRGSTLEFWVASSTVEGVEPSDENSGTERWAAPLRTIQEAINRIPKSFDGFVNIILAYNQNFNEEVIIAGFFGNGRVTLTNDGGMNTINGKIIVQKSITACTLERLLVNSTDGYTALDLNSSIGTVTDCIINGAAGGTTTAILVGAGGSWEVRNTAMYNVDYGIRTTFGGNAYAVDCTGETSRYAFQAMGSSKIAGGGTAPTGAIGNTTEYLGGTVKGSWTFPTPPAPPTPTPVEITKKYSANSGSGTWRADFGGIWDTGSSYGNAVTQGKWSGYGPFTGALIFGSAPSADVTGKTIKRIRVQLTRLSGGVYAAQNVVIRPHLSTSRPGVNVSLQSTNYAAGIKVGETRWITLPASFHAGFQNGTFKGLGINGGSYVKLSKTARLEITYE